MSIDRIFGTHNDLTELLDKAKEQGMKIIFDFIPNHSSDQHSWFQQSVRRENGYDDFYVWRPCNRIINDVRQPVNNWVISDLPDNLQSQPPYLLIRFPNITYQCGPTTHNAGNVTSINSHLVSPILIIVLITRTSLVRFSKLSHTGWT